jgi:hypothetical protein
MAQTTLDRITDRVRELSDRTTGAANQALSNVVSSPRSTRRAARRVQPRATTRLGIRAGTGAAKAVPAAVKTAWQAGEFTGRVEGLAGVIPNMTQLWLDRTGAKVRAQTASGSAKALARGVPTGVAGLRLIGRARNQAKKQGRGGRERNDLRDQVASLAKRAVGAAAITGGIASLRNRFSGAGHDTGKNVRKAAKGVRTVPRGWTLARRATGGGPLQNTQRRLRRSWRWVRYFTIGIAVGAIWAYLFAPRRQWGQQQAATTSASTEPQRTPAKY